MSAASPAAVPAGFELVKPRGPFTGVNGPFWKKTDAGEGAAVFGLMPEARHTNGLGFVHGGMVATFLDSAMAHTIHQKHGTRLVTIKLEITFIHATMRGRWTEAHVQIQEPVDQEVEATAELISRGQVCARSAGVFKLFP